MDKSIRPQDDFYGYANNRWLARHPIPEDKIEWGATGVLVEHVAGQVRGIIRQASRDKQAAPGSNDQRIRDFYRSAVNARKIERDGLKPLAIELRRIDKISSGKDVQTLLAHLHTIGVGAFFGMDVDQDLRNSKANIVEIGQGGVGLESADYLKRDERSQQLRTAYQGHVAKMFELMGESPMAAGRRAKTVMSIERKLAQASRTPEQLRDVEKNYNRMSVAQIQESFGNLDWSGYFRKLGLKNPGDVNVGQPEFFKQVSALLGSLPLEDVKTYFRWKLIDSMAPYLSSALANEDFAFNAKFRYGVQKRAPRWKRSVALVDSALGDAIGERYVQKYFPPQAKQQVLEMVEDIKAAAADHIKALTWMAPETKRKAIDLILNLKAKIGYTEKWTDYSKLTIRPDSLVGNILRTRLFYYKTMIKKADQPIDPAEWDMTPQTVNAYSGTNRNEIVFPAAILQPPFFNSKASKAANYGGIGAIIAHEMIHRIDDQGSKFDPDGNLSTWWTPADMKNFKKRTRHLAQQFDQYVPIDDVHVNGKLTLGENTADLAGLSIAYDAFRRASGSKAQNAGQDLSRDRKLFLSYARSWRSNIRDESLRELLKGDEHPPDKYRVLGPLSNIDAFYRAFGVKPGDKMYRPEKDRVVIW